MNTFIRNKKGDADHLGTAIGLLISVVLGAIIYTGVMGMINGPVANGIQSSFEAIEAQKGSISIEEKYENNNSNIVIEDFDYNETPIVDASDYFVSTVNVKLIERGESGYSAEYTAYSDSSIFTADFHINGDLAISKLKTMLGQGSIDSSSITCFLERPVQYSDNVVVTLTIFSNENEKVLNGNVENNTVTFDLSAIANDENLIGFIKGISSFKINVVENLETDAEYLTYYLDNIKYATTN